MTLFCSAQSGQIVITKCVKNKKITKQNIIIWIWSYGLRRLASHLKVLHPIGYPIRNRIVFLCKPKYIDIRFFCCYSRHWFLCALGTSKFRTCFLRGSPKQVIKSFFIVRATLFPLSAYCSRWKPPLVVLSRVKVEFLVLLKMILPFWISKVRINE